MPPPNGTPPIYPSTYPRSGPGDDDAWADEDFNGFTGGEMGYPLPQPHAPGQMPPGGGRDSIPQFLTFSALVRGAAKAFLFSSDEALRDSQVNAKAMRRDPVLMGSLRSIQMPVAMLSWHITPDDDTDPAQAEAAKVVEYVVKAIPRFQSMKMQLMEAVWFGKYACELEYEWREHRGEQKLFVRNFHPINGDKITHKWDGTPGVMVNSMFPGTKESVDRGLCHFLTPDERIQYIIHEFEPDDADWTEPEMAGAIHGVGVRGRLYWFWWLKQQVMAQLMNYLHRFANGLTIFYYNASDPAAKAEAMIAAKQQFSNTALLYPRWPSENPDTNKVERLEVGTANSNLLWNLVSEYFDPIMERYIKGQTLSSHAEATGLGSGVADLHGDTEDTRIKYLAIGLFETLQTDLINVLYSYNAPGVVPGKIEAEVDSPDAEKLMNYGDKLYNWGVPLDEDQAYKISQWQKPKPGGGIITQMGGMSPAAVGGVPQGVPVAGAAGPGQPPMDPSQGGMPMPPGMGQPVPMSRRAKRDAKANATQFHREVLERQRRLPQRRFSVAR